MFSIPCLSLGCQIVVWIKGLVKWHSDGDREGWTEQNGGERDQNQVLCVIQSYMYSKMLVWFLFSLLLLLPVETD